MNNNEKCEINSLVRDLGFKENKRTPKIRAREIPMLDTMLETRPAGDWISGKRAAGPARKLFGDFWHEGEIVVLFSYTGIGKSILSTQIP